jgi:tetratricopeptide (TPR) repeat protein
VDVAYDKQQFIDMIVYHEAANTVAGPNHIAERPWVKCYALYRMRRLEEAVHECTALIESNGDFMETRYFRGKAYEVSRQWDASIADLSPIADTAHHYYRVGAALDTSYDYGQKSDFAGQLTFMNAHPYLFDAEIMQDTHDLAVSYNNRCFAEMKLNLLQKALDDCTISLQYDRIPDALSKQQELLKLLAKTST